MPVFRYEIYETLHQEGDGALELPRLTHAAHGRLCSEGEKTPRECAVVNPFDVLPSGLSLRVEDRAVSMVEPLKEKKFGTALPANRDCAII